MLGAGAEKLKLKIICWSNCSTFQPRNAFGEKAVECLR